MTVTFKIEGGKELQAALSRLSPKLQSGVTRAAVRAGAQVIRKEAKLNVKSRAFESGVLYDSIDVVPRKKKRTHRFTSASVATRAGKKWQSKGKDAWYAHIIEYGSKQRPATPFLRPALDTKAGEAIKAMATKIANYIEKAALGPKVKR